jgi:hypothetical protein
MHIRCLFADGIIPYTVPLDLTPGITRYLDPLGICKVTLIPVDCPRLQHRQGRSHALRSMKVGSEALQVRIAMVKYDTWAANKETGGKTRL